MTKFKNLAAGARGLRDVKGDLYMIEPGQTATLDVDEHELADAKASRNFAIDGKKPAPLDDADEAADEGEPGLLDLSVAKLKEELAAIEDLAELEQLGKDETAGKSRSGALDAIQARIDELNAS